MSVEKGILSSSQFTFLLVGLLQGSVLTVSFVNSIARQSIWLVITITVLIMYPLLLIYTAICTRFPGHNLIQINKIIYGKYIGKLISVLYIFFFWLIIPNNLRFLGDFYTTYLFPETPLIVFLIVFAFICGWAVREGIEVVARCNIILVIATVVVAIMLTLLLLKDMKLSNFLPLFQIKTRELIQSSHVLVTIPFGEMNIMLMISAAVKDSKKIKKSVLCALFFNWIYYVFVITRNTMVLGALGSKFAVPSYMVARFINIGEIITRMEVLVALALIFTIFIKISLFIYVTVLAIAQFFNLREYKFLVYPVGIISIVLSIIIFKSPSEEAYIAANIYPFYATLFIVIFPLITLVLIKIRRLKGEEIEHN